MSNKIDQYREKMFNFVKRTFPNLEDDVIYEKIDEIIDDSKPRDDLIFKIKFFDQVSSNAQTSIDKLENELTRRDTIMTKYGTTYFKQEKQEALEAKMLDFTGVMRSKEKKEMFKHINDEDPTIMKRHNSKQQTYKASIMNSFYGVLTANGSIFRDLDCGESVTASGEEIIMTAIDSFEKFLTNNFHFYSVNDVVTYISNIIEENYSTEIDHTIELDDLIDFLNDHFYDSDYYKIKIDLRNNEMIMDYLNSLDNDQITKIYYKNNLYAFLENTELYKEFRKILKDKNNLFLDPNKPNEKQKEILDNIWAYVKDWVFYNHLDFNKYEFCKTGKRRTVLTVDTDSNFLYLRPAYKFFQKMIKEVDDSKEMKVCSINCITYLITNVINEAYLKFGELHNIPEEYRSRINMKNEFMLSRLLLTKNKKSYASSVLMKEGNLLEKQKIDLKGLAIKKSNTNKFVSDYFTNILKDDIIITDEIKYSNIIRKYFNLIDYIKDSFKNNKIEFTTPARVNEVSGYKVPENVMQVRGALIWNMLFPEYEISIPNNVNMCKIVIPTDMEENKEKIITYCKENKVEYTDDELNKFIERLDKVVNEGCYSGVDSKGNPVYIQLTKNGVLNILSIPKNIDTIPKFIRPFLNIDQMVLDNLNSGTIILDCLNIHTPKIDDNLIPTNILKI